MDTPSGVPILVKNGNLSSDQPCWRTEIVPLLLERLT